MGVVEGNRLLSDNDWESVKRLDQCIMKWIDEQLESCSCLVVLIGEYTANRKWINYEIERAFLKQKGVVGIYIHNLKNAQGKTGRKGENPFDYITVCGRKISENVICFEPDDLRSEGVYHTIRINLEMLVEHAILSNPSKWAW